MNYERVLGGISYTYITVFTLLLRNTLFRVTSPDSGTLRRRKLKATLVQQRSFKNKCDTV